MSPRFGSQLALSGVPVEPGVSPLTRCATLTTARAVIDNEEQIVALNVEQFGPGYPGQYCFKTITISVGGVTTQATVVDKVRLTPASYISSLDVFGTQCMGCPWGGLDFSAGLFSFFAPQSEGVLYGEWWFNN